MKAWNYIKIDFDQEMGQEYSTIVQIIVKADRGKAIAWRSVSCKMTCCHVQTEKQYKFSVCILYLVCILYPVCSLQSAFCTDRIGIAVFVRASLKSRPEYWTSKKNLVRLSWLMCGLYVEELPRKSTMKEQWLLYTNWRRMQMHGWPIWLPLMLFHVITECVEMSPLRVP